MIQIQLGADRLTDPTQDELGRSHVGYRDGMTEDEAWESARAAWKLNPSRAFDHDEVEVTAPSGTTVAVATLTGIIRAPAGRFILHGDVKHGDTRVGCPTVTPHPSRNPVAYV
jgi:hypothetical protein